MSVTTADGSAGASTVRYEYDAAGNTTRQIDALNHATTYTYDAANRLLSETDALSHTTTYHYDDAGRRDRMIDANNRPTDYTYDVRDRLLVTTYADGTTDRRSYDSADNLSSATDQAGKTTTYTYNATRQLQSVIDPLTHSTQYTYDPLGRLLSVTDANLHTTSFAYDDDGRLIRKTWPDLITFEGFAYDNAGNLTAHRLADGHTNTFAYDALNRKIRDNYFDGKTFAYTYTPTGQRATTADTRGITHYTYDEQDRLTQITLPGGQVIAYTYTVTGNRHTLTTPAGTTTYTYDAADRLTGVTDPQNGTAEYEYDPVGLRTRRSLPNGITTDYTYDELNRLRSITHHQGARRPLASYTYSLDPAGHRLGVTNQDGSSVQWSYDAAYRLTSETVRDGANTVLGQAAYSYDAVGNRSQIVVDGQTTTASYNALDQLIQTSGATDAQYHYDGRGNLTQVTRGGDAINYTYDAANRLTQVTLPDARSASYAYDADGWRIQQQSGGTTTNYLWDETSPYGDVLVETDSSGAIQASYVLGESELIAQRRGGATSYYLQDGQNSVRALADASGASTDTYSYNAFGDLRARQGSTINPYRYTGQQFDEQTGLYSLRARYYNPNDARFLSRDTAAIDLIDPAELNRYGYTADDPINGYDPTGYEAEEYGIITTIRLGVTRSAVVLGSRAGAAIAAAKGAFDALDARFISWAIRAQIAIEQGFVGRAMQNLTVAQTTVLTEEGEQHTIVAINGASRSEPVMRALTTVINDLRARGIDAFIADGDTHAEVAAYQRALTYTNNIVSIGISNTGGPCGPEAQNCAAYFDNLKITVFYLGRLILQKGE